jgi:hypothetical protein
MRAPGKTTLYRMQLAAQQAAERIEIAQDDWVRRGVLKQPEAGEVARRDDFAGMVRMIEIIQSDALMLERLKAGRARQAAAGKAPAAAAEQDEEAETE